MWHVTFLKCYLFLFKVKFNLAVDAIFEAESLTVDAQDIDAEMKLQEEQYKVDFFKLYESLFQVRIVVNLSLKVSVI